MAILTIIYIFLSGFLGYIIGRIGDYYINFWMRDPWWAPHHWIYGALIMAASFFVFLNYGGVLFSFGAGLLISDLKDFFELKFLGSDNKTLETRRFWHID